MSKKKKKSSFRNQRVNLADLRKESPAPISSVDVEPQVVDEMVSMFLKSQELAHMQNVQDAGRKADALSIQVRQLAREQEELKLQKSMLERDKALLEQKAAANVETRQAKKTVAKDRFLKHKDVADWRTWLGKKFASTINEWVDKGVALDAEYQRLEAEGLTMLKQAEKLMSSIEKKGKAIERLETRITRLQADVAKLGEIKL